MKSAIYICWLGGAARCSSVLMIAIKRMSNDMEMYVCGRSDFHVRSKTDIIHIHY